MKILIDDTLYSPVGYAVVKGVRGVERFRMVDVGAAGVVAIEADVGEKIFVSGDAEQVFIRSDGADVVISGRFAQVEIWARDVYFINATVDSGVSKNVRSVIVQGSVLKNFDVTSELFDFIILHSSNIENISLKSDGVTYALWSGTRKRPLEILGGRIHLGHIKKWWIAGTQLWDGGVIVDVSRADRLIFTGMVKLGSVSISEDLEWVVSRKDYQRELAEIIEVVRGGDEDGKFEG